MSHTYKKNYLKQVIFRIDFTKIELKEFEQLKSDLKSRFEIGEKKNIKLSDFEIKADSAEPIVSTKDIEIWQFANAKTGNKFEVGPEHCLLEYFAYKDSSVLQKDVSELCGSLLNNYAVNEVQRVGLRYINQISVSAIRKIDDWKKFIIPELLMASNFLKDKGKSPTRILNRIEFKTENFSTRFSYGIWNENYPSPITNNAYILDIDSYTRLPLELNTNSLIELLGLLNKEAECIFELSITNALRKEMDK